MRLIPMDDFVLKQNKVLEKYINHLRRPLFERCVRYAQFLKQPSIREMFLPIGEQGNVLKEPDFYKLYKENKHVLKYLSEHELLICQQYEKAKEKVLFKGFYESPISKKHVHYKFSDGTTLNILIDGTIGQLMRYEYFELTETAIKQFV